MSETGTELAVIEAAMQDTRGEYYNAPKDDTGHTPMQARYRELTEAKEAGNEPPATVREVAPAPEAALSPEVVAFAESPECRAIYDELEKAGGYEKNIAAGSAIGDAFMLTIDPETRAGFSEQVNRLSVGVQMGILAELSNPYMRVPAASAREVTQFTNSTPEAGEMVAEWGADAPRNIAKFRARYKRLVGRLSANDATALGTFIDHITSEEFKTIMRYFAGAV